MEPLSAQAGDARRDALAILATILDDDHEAIGTVVHHCNPVLVIAALAGMLIEQLRDQGIEPAGWVEAAQERAAGEMG